MGAAMLARPEPEAPAAAAPADNSMLELIQGMLMQQSSSLAKFEKKMDDRTSNLESMSMQSAMNGAKQTSQTGASHTQPQSETHARFLLRVCGPLPLGEAAVRAVLYWVYFGSLSLGSIYLWVLGVAIMLSDRQPFTSHHARVSLALWQAQRDPFRCAQRECVANGREVRGGWYA
jgi:type IV secretory pathway VirB2 component (pilin)